jgi:alpha-tubulin suppressor-like RCC1 family protein
MKELTNIEAVAAGNQTAYALSRDGSVWAWGENAWGELGDGKVGNESDVPAKVVGLSNVSVIAANWPSAYAVIGG